MDSNDIIAARATEVLSGPTARTVVLAPRPGERIGRYLVLQPLGVGGMGTVLRAHDPDLDRDVAIKLLRRSAAELPDGAARLIREARSMALVTDPHVVQVFEVGVDRGRVYVAMELVEGDDLRAWLRTPRSLVDVLDVFEQAGRGLAAAHRAGLLHRDFKPDNVLIGCDPAGVRTFGRVRVGDFGLAQLAHSQPSSEPTGRHASVDSSQRLTRTGTVLGTPLYMAPEQHANDAIDERADQFAFCAALYEALWHQLPYRGRSTDELARGKVTGPADTPREPHVPTAVRRAVLRGLAPDPADRHPDMDALLAALRARPRSRRPALALAGSAAVALVLLAAGATREDPRCTDGARRLAGVWDDSTRAAVHEAFSAADRPYTRDSWQHVATTLDGWAVHWIAAHEASCTAALADDADELALDRRMTCLEGARHELRALVDLLAVADDTLVLGAVRATAALPDPTQCIADSDAPVASTPPAVREAFARVRALAHAGRYADAWREAERLPEHPEVQADPALAAEAALWLGRMRHRTSSFAAAEQALGDAYFHAQRAERPDLAAEAAVALLGVVAEAHPDSADAEQWARHAAAALASIDGGSPRTAAALHRGLGNLAMRTGDYERARTETELGMRLLVAELGEDHLDIGDFHNNLGNVAFVQARYDEAIALHERALAIRRRHLGEHHPVVGDSYNNLGAAAYNVGRYDESARWHEQSLAISRAAFGERHPDVAASHNNLGGVYFALGRHDDAIDHYRAAIEIWTETLAADHPDVAFAYNNLGNVLQALGRHDEAAQHYEHALAIREEVLGPEHPDVAITLGNLAVTDMATNRLARAQTGLQRAIATFERVLGPDHPDAATLLDNLGVVKRRQGDPAAAIDLHRRALRIHVAALGADHPQTATTEYGLGLALHALGEREAIDHLQKAVAGTPAELAALQRERTTALDTARRGARFTEAASAGASP